MPRYASPDYDPMMDELPPELAAEYKAEQRKQKIAQIMSGQAMTPLQAPEVKGRFQGAISPIAGLAQLAQAYMSSRMADGADKNIADIGRRKQDMYSADVKRVGEVMTGRPDEVMPPDVAGPPQPGMPAGTPEQVAAAMMESKFPSIARHGFGQLDQAQKQKQIAEDRAALAAQNAADRAAREKENAKDRFAQQESMARLAASLRPAPQGRAEPAPMREVDNEGNVKYYDQKGNLIKDLGKIGKPSAGYQKAETAKKKTAGDLDMTITELEKATKDGGLIDQSTGSGAGALVDMGASFFGKSTPGAVAAGRMAPIFDMALKMVPRFEGPQSDKDTQSYKDAAGQLANPATPNETKKAAGREILRLMKQRRGQFIDKSIEGTEADVPSGGGAVRTVDW